MITQENIPYTADEIKAMVKTCEKYNKALEKARELMNKGYDVLMPEIFPELQESEGERIMVELTEFLKSASGGFLNSAIRCETFGEWLAWLEEQKDYIKLPNSAYTSNKDVIEFADTYSHDVWEKLMDNFKKIENYHIGCNDVSDIVLNAIINTYNWLEKQDKEEHILKSSRDEDVDKFMRYIEKQAKAYEFNLPNRGYDIYGFAKDILQWLEKQDENKPNFNADDWYVGKVDGKIYNMTHNPTDKPTPKFKVRDFIANDYCSGKVIEITNDAYLLDTGQGMPLSCEHNIHLWTIADAKDGDVLQLGGVTAIFQEYIGNENCKCYCSVCDGNFEIPIKNEEDNIYGCTNTTPATKEQCDLLFKKMKEAGYVWDNEKKELKKVEQKPDDNVEPKFKPGDWIIFNGLILHIDEVVNGYYRTTSRGDGIHNSYDWNIDNAARLWTIQEAKDGDVLVHNGCPFIFMGIKDGVVQALEENLLEGTNPVNFGEPKIDNDYQPSIKEQRDLLFQKMKEAGYKWDSENKELKKIEPKTLDADKVVAWLVANFEYYIKLFKKDFEL